MGSCSSLCAAVCEIGGGGRRGLEAMKVKRSRKEEEEMVRKKGEGEVKRRGLESKQTSDTSFGASGASEKKRMVCVPNSLKASEASEHPNRASYSTKTYRIQNKDILIVVPHLHNISSSSLLRRRSSSPNKYS